MIGNDKDFLATRVAYHLNLRGPSLNVQTGCSTSLVATHLACQSLLGYQCDVALAGGVSVHVPQRTGYLLPGRRHHVAGRALPAFDAQAAGHALRQRRGRGGAQAAGGRARRTATPSTPSSAARPSTTTARRRSATPRRASRDRRRSSRGAQAVAGVTPDTIGYVEAHGTGTPLGDPVEVAGADARPSARAPRPPASARSAR